MKFSFQFLDVHHQQLKCIIFNLLLKWLPFYLPHFKKFQICLIYLNYFFPFFKYLQLRVTIPIIQNLRKGTFYFFIIFSYSQAYSLGHYQKEPYIKMILEIQGHSMVLAVFSIYQRQAIHCSELQYSYTFSCSLVLMGI